MDRIHPAIIKHANEKQLNECFDKVNINFPIGSPEYRKYMQHIRLLKKLNDKEFKAATTDTRPNRFTR
jgi:hypothetical protein